MTNERFNELIKDETSKTILEFIPNELGINLCSVDDVIIVRQKDGQIKEICISFIPADVLDKIRDAIEREADYQDANVNADVAKGMYMALEMIDKHTK